MFHLFILMSLLKLSGLKTTVGFFLKRKMFFYFFLQFLLTSAEQNSVHHNKLRGGEQQWENAGDKIFELRSFYCTSYIYSASGIE